MTNDVRGARPTESTSEPEEARDLSGRGTAATGLSSAAALERRSFGAGEPLSEAELFAAYDVDPRERRGL